MAEMLQGLSLDHEGASLLTEQDRPLQRDPWKKKEVQTEAEL